MAGQGHSHTAVWSFHILLARYVRRSRWRTPTFGMNWLILHSKLASFWVRFARYKKVMSFVFSNFLASFPRFCVFLRAVMASEARSPVLPGCFAEKRTGARFLPFAAPRIGMTQLGKVSRKAVIGDESAHWILKIGFVLGSFCTLRKVPSFVFSNILALFVCFDVF